MDRLNAKPRCQTIFQNGEFIGQRIGCFKLEHLEAVCRRSGTATELCGISSLSQSGLDPLFSAVIGLESDLLSDVNLPVLPRAFQANPNAIGHGCPLGVVGTAFEALPILKLRL